MSQEQFYQTVQLQEEYEMKSWLMQFMEEQADVLYCPICLTPVGAKQLCCDDYQFIEFKYFDEETQRQIAADEWEMRT